MKRFRNKEVTKSRVRLLWLYLLALFCIGWFFYQSLDTSLGAVHQQIQAQSKLAEFPESFSSFAEAETQEYGYLLAKPEQLLVPHNTVTSLNERKPQQLETVLSDSSRQQRSFNAIKSLTAQRLTLIKPFINSQIPKNVDVPVEATLPAQEKVLVDQIWASISPINHQKQQAFQLNAEKSATQSRNILVIFLGGYSLSLVIFLRIYYLLNDQLIERQRIQAELQDLYNNAPCGYYTLDTNGNLIAINTTQLSWLGYSHDEVIGKLKITDLLTDESFLTFQEIFPHLQEQGWVKDLEYQMIRKDGTIFPVLVNTMAMTDAAGNFVATRSTVFDISVRKQAEEALRQSEEQLRLALEAAHLGTWDWNVLTNQVTWSSSQEELFGLAVGSFDGSYEAFAACLHPDDREVVIQTVRLAYQSHNDYHQEFRVVWPDGSIHWIEAKGKFYYDREGRAVRMLGTVMDISDRKHREEQLRLLESVVLTTNDAVVITQAEPIDLPGPRIIYVNPAFTRITGYTSEEVIGQTPRLLQGGNTDRATLNQIRAALVRWDSVRLDVSNYRKDGSQFWAEMSIVPVANEKGQFTHWIAIQRDISQRKQVEAELKTRAQQQAVIAQLGQQALASSELFHLMNQAVERIAQILNVEYCSVLELLPNSKTLLLKAGVGWQEGRIGQITVTVETDSQAGYTLASSDPVIVENLRTEVRFRGSPLLQEHEVVSGISVVIQGQNRPYGILEAYTTQQRQFTKDDVYFLQAAAHVLATASDRQYVEEALHRAYDELEIRVQERTAEFENANLELQQEVTERKQAEEERAKLIAILEATSDFVATASVDERIRYLNGAARKIFGFGKDEDLAGFTIWDTCPNWAYEIIHNEGIPIAIRDGVWIGETAFLSQNSAAGCISDTEAVATLGASAPPVEKQVQGTEDGIVGREIPVSQLIIAHKAPDGRVNLLSTVARDITQQKKIEATLLEAERRWRSLLENVHLAVVGLDRTGKVEYINPFFLELVGYTKAEVKGQDWFEMFVPPHQRVQLKDHFLKLLELAHEVYTHDRNTILTKSGEERVVAWNNTLLHNLQGDVVGIMSIGEDITERHAIERMKDEFISVVSHELRTPLTSIHGALNLLATGLLDAKSDRGQRVIEIAAESAERLVRLVNDILELERLDGGKICLLMQQCNAANLVRKAIDMMQVVANRSGITLLAFPQSIELDADCDRIIQVLTNLLDNAIKFSSTGSTIRLSVELGTGDWELGTREKAQGDKETHRYGDFVEELPTSSRPLLSACNEVPSSARSLNSNPTVLFMVKDQGRGIPADKLESIFERFHQVDASDSRKKGGTGLGLAICRSIVQQHGGRIWVESTLGEGSTFYFTLPVKVQEDNHDNQAHLGD
jgi:PAS domain S-box-containing protein